MAASSDNTSDLSPLGRLLSLLGLVAAALYFTGWIYRWAYFGFFQIEVTSLDLPGESFFLAAFQALAGHPLTILKTVVAVVLISLICFLLVEVRQKLTINLSRRISFRRLQNTSKILPFLGGLVDELIVVLVILTALFWLARWQAIADVWKDATNETSALPVVTLVFADDDAALGRLLDPSKESYNPENLRVMGDRNTYMNQLGSELTNIDDPDWPRVWRLLLDKDGILYVFPALPVKDRSLRPPVLAFQSSDSKVTILSPRVSD